MPTAITSGDFLVKTGAATAADAAAVAAIAAAADAVVAAVPDPAAATAAASMAEAVTAALARCSFSRNSPRFSLESDPPSGEPDEYMVASLPSRMNLNQPLEPLDSSSAAASDQM